MKKETQVLLKRIKGYSFLNRIVDSMIVVTNSEGLESIR